MHKTNTIPKLAPAGAGVPLPQMLMMRFLIGPFIAGKTTVENSEKKLLAITEKIITETKNLSTEQLHTKILVPQQIGLEDSSRYWSIAMTIEHIVIVGAGISKIIVELSNGNIPTTVANTAAVKPLGELNINEVLGLFNNLNINDYAAAATAAHKKSNNLKFNHPWFGAFNTQQWFWLLATHQVVHLKQIRAIKKGLV